MSHSGSIAAYIEHLYAPTNRAFAFVSQAGQDFTAWSQAFRPALQELIGLNHIRESIADFRPSVELGEAEDLGEFTRQAGTLHTEPCFDVPFWYLKPKTPGPHPLGLFPHGHAADRGFDLPAGLARNEHDRARMLREDRDVAVQAVRLGVAAIAPATRGFAPACIPDLNKRHGGSDCRSQLVHALLAGRTAIGERVWDMARLIDWGQAQQDVNGSKVLLMGNSGGGVVTLYTAACDERITAAVASCSFCSFVGAGGLVHHCDCNLVPGILGMGESWDVAGLVAPRHLLCVNGREDPLFPLEEVDRAAAGARAIFQAAGAADRFGHRYGQGGHRFYKDLMWPFVLEALSLSP